MRYFQRLAPRPQRREIRVPGQRVNQLFTVMKKGLRTDFGLRQSPPSVHSAGSKGPAGSCVLASAIEGRRAAKT